VKTSAEHSFPKGILLCFFLSGAAGLIYEVAWARALALIFGHTAYAISIVLATFMGGLALGSACFGPWGERHPAPIKLYARIELLVAASAVLSLAGLRGVRSLYIAAYPALSSAQVLLATLRILGAALILFVPTVLMGATFPILLSGVTRTSAELGTRVSQFYWVNTSGGVVGTLICGFVLLPTLGLRLSVLFGVVLNTVAGILALRIASSPRLERKATSTPENGVVAKRKLYYFLLLVLWTVGFTGFSYEIAWTRILEVMIGSSTYAFTLMLAMFLAGIVLGSIVFECFVRRGMISIVFLARVQLTIGVLTLISLISVTAVAVSIPSLVRLTGGTFVGVFVAQVLASGILLLPVATLFGFSFPLVTLLVGSNANAQGYGTTVGYAYAANTVGCVAGSIVTAFLLVPYVGSFRAIAGVAACNILLALLLDLYQHWRIRALVTHLAVLVAVAIVAASPTFYNRSILSISAILYGNPPHLNLTLPEIAATKELVFVKEGVNESVAVVRTDDSLALRINGKVDASTDDFRTQLMLGHLAAALHSGVRRVLVIGFGSGMTVSAVARYPTVDRIDCVEIEPAVLSAAPYLRSLNRDVLTDHRVHVIFDDARSFLLTSKEKYDLVISEPSNPWMAGVATLFTDEYYAAAQERLTADGIFVQWIQAYSIAPQDLRMVMATFTAHFPDTSLWRGGETDLLLLGRKSSAVLKFDHLHSLWGNQDLGADFEKLNIHKPEGLMAYFLLDDASVRQLAAGSVTNTDDRTLLEYDAPRTLLKSDLIDADQALLATVRTTPLPSNLASSEIRSSAEAAVATALDLGDRVTAQMLADVLQKQSPSVAFYVAEARLALAGNSPLRATSLLTLALDLDRNSLETLHWLAIAEYRSGDYIAARTRVDELLARDPRFMPALDDQLQFAVDQNDMRTALAAQLMRLNLMVTPPAYEYCRLGGIWLKLSNLSEANAVLLTGLRKDPYSYACHVELGELYAQMGRLSMARDNLEWAIRFFPEADPDIFKSLAAIYTALGDFDSARRTMNKGVRLFPGNSILGNQSLRADH